MTNHNIGKLLKLFAMCGEQRFDGLWVSYYHLRLTKYFKEAMQQVPRIDYDVEKLQKRLFMWMQ
jgi:hypothetical protein